MQEQIVNQWKTFEEPQFDESGNLKNSKKDAVKKIKTTKERNQSDSDDNEQVEEEADLRLEMDLLEGCLKVNLGIPIIVVVNKVDLLLHGDKKAFLEENFDFIQKHIREYSL